MIIATENDLLTLIQSSERLDPAVRRAWEIAAAHPHAFFCFMRGFVEFNFYAAPSATRLAANLKLSHMDAAASAVFAALPDEYGKPSAGADHRTLALGLLSVAGDYAELPADERDRPLPEWHKDITNRLQKLYQGEVGDRASLIRAIGAHWASERLADTEYADGDRIVRHENAGRGFDEYIRKKYTVENPHDSEQCEMTFRQWKFDPWIWIKFHGEADSHAAEFRHFLHAQSAVNIVLRNCRPDSAKQVWEWLTGGAREFAELQNRFFTNIAKECEAIVFQNA